MQDYKEIVEIVLLISSIIIMGKGVLCDIKERRYPNSILMSTIVIGIFYSFYSGRIMESIIGFIIVNIIGIIFHKYKLMASGDMKYLSTLFLFISIRDIQSCLMLIAFMLVIALIQGYIFYRKLNVDIKNEMKKQMFAYKALFLYRINTFSRLDFNSKDEMLEKSIPFTMPMYFAYVLTIIISYAISAYW